MNRWSLPKHVLFASVIPILGACPCNGSPIEWSENLAQAAKLSKQLNKPMLIKVSTDWCGYCNKMQVDTFENRRVAAHVRECFIPVALDGDRDAALVQRMGVQSYPTTLVVSNRMKIVKRITGYRTPNQFTDDLVGLCEKPNSSNSAPSRSAQAVKESDRGTRKIDDVSPRGVTSLFGPWCPVSPISDAKFTKGRTEIRNIFRGHELHFANQKNLRLFLENPHRYWPVADGQCIVSLLDDNVARQGHLRFGFDYRNRIWLFSGEERLNRFKAHPETYLRSLSVMLAERSKLPH